MSSLNKFKSPAQSYGLEAFFAPGHWFFCRRIEIPEDLEAGEETDYVLLELENLSPFPLEHMFYGLRLDKSKRHAFVYAAYRRRFEKVDQSGWRKIDAVLPDFVAGLGFEMIPGECLVLVSETSFVALPFDAQSSLPGGFYAEARRKAEEGETPIPLDAQVAAFANRAETCFSSSSTRIYFTDTNAKWVGQKALLGVRLTEDSEAAETGVSFTRDEMWSADLRDPDLLNQAKRDERQNRILWKTVIGFAACVGLLLLGELYFGLSSAYYAYRTNRIENRAPEVAQIRDLRVTSSTLRDFKEANLSPFEMISALFPYQQYPKIVYRKFEAGDPDVLIIDAKAANQSEVTEFKKRLERFDKVSTVELSKQVNNTKGSTFTATIRFAPGAFYEIAEVSSDG